MKITAQLAKSQLKVNRLRTIWTLLAIVLSTALTTTVCSFIASGNATLKEFLGESYGEYGGTYLSLLLIPAVIFGFLILAMSVTVISNVFRISTGERMAQFGILKCTGATARQIKDSIIYESIFLCVAGIPMGIAAGLILAFLAVGVANHFLGNLNKLVHIMIQELTVSMHFVISPAAILASVVISFLTVLYSAWRPAHKAAKLSAVSCIYGTNGTQGDAKTFKDHKWIQKAFGFEGMLADKNIRRNHRNFRATVLALSIGVILFVSLGGLSLQARGIQDFMDPHIEETVMSEYISAYDERENEKTQRKETTFRHPISSALGDEITKKIEAQEGQEVWGMGNDLNTYYTVLQKGQISTDMQKACQESRVEKKEEYEFPVEIIAVDTENYEKLCKKAGVPSGSKLLINHYRYNDFGHEANILLFSKKMAKLNLMKADGSTEEVSVDGMLTEEQMPAELFYVGANPVRLIVPKATVRGYTWYCKPEDEAGYMKDMNILLKKEFPTSAESSYMEEGFSTRVYKVDEYIQVMNIAVALVSIFMYSFVALLMLIGLTNIISTLSTNVMMRAREFAVLKSVGMTSESLKHMLSYESILCSVKAISLGVPLGIAITILVNLPIRRVYPVAYEVPWLSIVLCVLVVFLITQGTTRYAVRKLSQQNIMEAIRGQQ